MDIYKADQIYKDAIEVYGAINQIKRWHEEVGELMKAISKYDRDPTPENLDHLNEEIQDVKIMTAQLDKMMPEDRSKYWFDFKMNRLQLRIKAKKEKFNALFGTNKTISIEDFLNNVTKIGPHVSGFDINLMIETLSEMKSKI